jgi:hypothetical protein
MWLAFFFFGLCSQNKLDFRFVPLFLTSAENAFRTLSNEIPVNVK